MCLETEIIDPYILAFGQLVVDGSVAARRTANQKGRGSNPRPDEKEEAAFHVRHTGSRAGGVASPIIPASSFLPVAKPAGQRATHVVLLLVVVVLVLEDL